MVGGLGGGKGLGIASGNMLDAVGMPQGIASEMSKMMDETIGELRSMLTDLQKAFGDAARPPSGPVGQFGPVSTAGLSQLVVRLSYIAILKEAMNKAKDGKLFNVETAINDLWVHLDSLKRMGGGPTLASGGAAATSQELSKLAAMIEKRGALFRALSGLVQAQSQAHRAATPDPTRAFR